MTGDDVGTPSVSPPPGWEQTEDRTESLYELGPVRVRGHTVVYGDGDLTERVAAHTDGEAFRRFFFATRIRVEPRTAQSTALTRLVTSQARSGFTDRLADRGIGGVEARDTRSLRIGGTDATLVQYGGSCDVGDVSLTVEGYVAVWPAADGDYLVAGGAYPTAVTDGNDDVTAAVSDLLDPSTFRDDLLSLVRSTR